MNVLTLMRRRADVIGLGLLLVLGLVVIYQLDSTTAALAVLALYYAIAGLSFSFIQGTIGLFSMAQPVFLAIGGYTGAYLSLKAGLSPWIGILVAVAFAAIIALPIALASIRSKTSAILVALVTLIISQAVAPVIISIGPLGGSLGLLLSRQPNPSFLEMQGDSTFFGQILLVFNVILIGGFIAFRNSRYGSWAVAIRDSPDAAAAVGIPVRRTQIVLFMVSAVMVAPAGVVYAMYNLNVTVDMFLGAAALFQVVVVALIGGSARPWGPLVGSIVVVFLTDRATTISGGLPGVASLTFAMLFMIMALVLPRGLSGTWDLIVEKRVARRQSGTAGSVAIVRSPAAPTPGQDAFAASAEQIDGGQSDPAPRISAPTTPG